MSTQLKKMVETFICDTEFEAEQLITNAKEEERTGAFELVKTSSERKVKRGKKDEPDEEYFICILTKAYPII